MSCFSGEMVVRAEGMAYRSAGGSSIATACAPYAALTKRLRRATQGHIGVIIMLKKTSIPPILGHAAQQYKHVSWYGVGP
jgi:hypothetical protein